MYKKILTLIALIGLVCNASFAQKNSLSAAEKADGWYLLFDGKTTNGWHIYNEGDVASAWIVADEELYCNPDTFDVVHGDLVTDEIYENFDLKFEWKITTGGNSGVFYNVTESEDYPRAWTTGPEYQLLDNLGIYKEYLDNKTHWCGTLYGIHPSLNVVAYRPAGQWNESQIKQENGVVTYWLNGVKTAEQQLYGTDWQALVAKSSFKNFADYGKTTKGHIALQDWSKGVTFRNIKIKEL